MGQKSAITNLCYHLVVTDLLVKFRKAYPNVTINILDNTNKALVRSLQTNEANIGVYAHAEFNDALYFEPVLEDRYCAVVPSDYVLTKITKVTRDHLFGRAFRGDGAMKRRARALRNQVAPTRL